MTAEILFVFSVVTIAGLLFISGKARLDIVAMLVVLALILGGILTPAEALAGFGQPVVIIVIGLLILSEMLTRTGVAHNIGNWLVRYGRNGEVRLLILLTLIVCVLGCFMSNTAVVAIFIPVVMSVANTTNLNPSRLLMPLAHAAIVSGMLTLVATTSNLVVSEELVRSGYEPFGFFAFTPIGLVMVVIFIFYMALVGRHLMPGERIAPPKTAAWSVRELLSEFELPGGAYRLKVTANSKLVGKTLAESAIGRDYGVRVTMIERPGPLGAGITTTPPATREIRSGDILVVRSLPARLEEVRAAYNLHLLPITDADRGRWLQETGIAKVLIHPDSRLLDNTLRELNLHTNYGIQVLGLRRKNETLPDFLDTVIKNGDAMLVAGPWRRIRQLQKNLRDFVVLALPVEIEQVASSWQRAPISIAILALMVLLTVFKIVPIVVSVMICALLAVISRCLTMEQAYSSIQWNSVVLLGGMMSIAVAATKTGAMDLIVGQLVGGLGTAGPYAMLTILFILSTLISMVLSGTPAAILLAPIAIQAASALEVTPYAFCMTVGIATSAGFIMPATNSSAMLVMGPGKYHPMDFIKVGFPMLIFTAIITILFTPLLFPF